MGKTWSRSAAEARLHRLAMHQHGLVSRGELADLGFDARTVRGWKAKGWQEVAPGVLLLPGVPATWEQTAMAACLSVHGVLSHQGAARLWGLEGTREAPVVVSIDAARRPEPREFQVMRRADHALLRIRRVASIPVTSPADSWLDLAGVADFDEDEMEAALDELLRRRLVSGRDIESAMQRRGHYARGIALVRAVLASRRPEDGTALSRWSRRVQRMLVAAGLPRPVTEYQITVAGRLVAQVDLAYPQARLAIELQSKGFHVSAHALETDSARARSVQLAGWHFLPATWHQTMVRPERFIADVGNFLEGR